MATTSDVKVTAGTGTNVATYDITEDAETKKLQRVVLSTNAGADIDFTAVSPVKIDQTTPGTTNLVAADIIKVAGSAIAQGHGVAATALRVELPTDGTGVVGLIAGTAKVGVVTTDQTTHGTTDLVAADQIKIAGTAILTGNGATGAGSQRVTIASDNSAVPVSSASLGFDVATTITRPANTTAYTAGDVVGLTGGAALDLGVLGTSAAAVQIVGVQLEADITAIPAGQTSWTLHLYNVTPPSALADNAAWDLPSGDRASYLGNIAITTLVDLGSTLYVEINNIFKQLRLSGTHVFGYLVTVGGFTPGANSEVYKLTLHTMVI